MDNQPDAAPVIRGRSSPRRSTRTVHLGSPVLVTSLESAYYGHDLVASQHDSARAVGRLRSLFAGPRPGEGRDERRRRPVREAAVVVRWRTGVCRSHRGYERALAGPAWINGPDHQFRSQHDNEIGRRAAQASRDGIGDRPPIALPLGPLVAVDPASRRFLLALEPIPRTGPAPISRPMSLAPSRRSRQPVRSPPHAWQLTAYAGVRCPARAKYCCACSGRPVSSRVFPSM